MMAENDGKDREWNAYIVAPMLFAGGIGVMAGAAFSIGKPAYAVCIVIGVGLCVALAGVVMAYQLKRGTYPTHRSDDEVDTESETEKK